MHSAVRQELPWSDKCVRLLSVKAQSLLVINPTSVRLICINVADLMWATAQMSGPHLASRFTLPVCH